MNGKHKRMRSVRPISHLLERQNRIGLAKSTVLRLATLVLGLCLTLPTVAQPLRAIDVPGKNAFPESITSTRDGTLLVGRLGEGGIVRANPRTGRSALFVVPGSSGSRSITGVFADDATDTLWACSNDLSALGGTTSGRDHGSSLKSFDLKTGVARRSVSLLGAHPFCNDIAIDSGGTVYVTDSADPNVLRLRAGASAFEVFVSNSKFLPPASGGAGLDGIAFGVDGNLYVTTYAAGALFRVDVKNGQAGHVTKLQGGPLTLPDALRPSGEKSFLLVEGGGTLDRVDIQGDAFKATAIRGGFRVPTSVTRVGATAWVSEGQMSFFFDRSHKNQSPSLPFRIYAVPLSKGQTQ